MEPKDLAKLREYGGPKKLGDLPVHVNLFIYGTHGVGKTIVGCSVKKPDGMVLLHPLDGDWKSLLNPQHKELYDSTDIEEFRDFIQLKYIAKALRYQVEPYDTYDTFVLDPTSSWVSGFLRAFKKNVSYGTRDPRASLVHENKDGLAMIKGFDIKASDWRDFGAVRDELELIVIDLIEAPVNVIFLSHEREPADDDKGPYKNKIRPDMPNKSLTVVARKCDAIGHMTRNRNQRKIKFETNNQSESKSRLYYLENESIDADNLPNLINEFRFSREGK